MSRLTLHQPQAQVFIPDRVPQTEAAAFSRITHLGIGAHQDDLEFMAFHGILNCYRKPDQWFGGVTCTDGAGSARSGRYEHYSDEDMQRVRIEEQNNAAIVGGYGAMIQLGYPSSVVKSPHVHSLQTDLLSILRATQPQVVYTHNPADKHDTHIGVVVATLDALRELPPEQRPQAVYGCEVWRNLDWMLDDEKVLLNLSGHESLAAALSSLFDSQIAGGKRYDLAVTGRHRANATFLDAHSTDESSTIAYAMDLTPLITDPTTDIIDYVLSAIQRFEHDVRQNLSRKLGIQRTTHV
ncbi:MAG: PIG-L family deacetylase [Prosthecobacter sp.]